jgi:hypothetical protein
MLRLARGVCWTCYNWKQGQCSTSEVSEHSVWLGMQGVCCCKRVRILIKSSMLLCSAICCRSYTGGPRELTMSLLHDLGLD